MAYNAGSMMVVHEPDETYTMFVCCEPRPNKPRPNKPRPDKPRPDGRRPAGGSDARRVAGE
jgi:hypothetical protein